MKRIALSLLILAVTAVYGQNYDKLNQLASEGAIKELILEYEKFYKQDSTKRIINLGYASVLTMDNQVDKAFEILTKYAKNDSSVRALTDADLYLLHKDPRWEEIEKLLINNTEVKFGKYKNRELSRKLWAAQAKDQAYYYQIELVEKKFGRNSVVEKAIWDLKKRMNKENQILLDSIVAVDGWPLQSVVGRSASTSAFLIVQHSDIAFQKKHLDKMTEAAQKGELAWHSLALLIDRVNLREGKEQIYGSQIFTDENGEYYVKDLKDPETVNERRKEVGLQPIEDYISHWGLNWKDELKKMKKEL